MDRNNSDERRLREIAWAFLRLGFVAFGGALAHIALMEDEFVRRRAWLSHEEFVDRVGAVNLLPGPTSTEMVIYLGQLRGGFPGLLIAGTAFILPSARMLFAMACIYVRFGAMPQITGLLWGVKPVVVVLTNYALPQYREQALALGAHHFLDKSAAFDLLPDLIRDLGRQRLHEVAPELKISRGD